MTNKAIPPDTSVSPPDPMSLTEECCKALITWTAAHAQKLLIYSRDEGLSTRQTFSSMVLCVAMLAHTLNIDEEAVRAGIDAALADLNSEDEEE